MPQITPDPAGLSRAEFVARFGGVYEHSPWAAEGAFDIGLPAGGDPHALSSVLATVVEEAGPDAQLALLRAHPDLAGRLAVAGELTDASTAEQASAGLDQCTEAEFAEFTELNTRYTARFGFPFILAVRGRSRAEILAAFRDRVENEREAEFREALTQVHRIALLRLEALAG